MRFAVATLAALILLMPGAAALAATSYQTPNGQKSGSSMAAELRAVGHGAPWDEASVVAAYARTTGGAVNPSGTSALPPASAGSRHDAVVFITGFQASAASFTEDFGLVRFGLSLNEGFSSADMLPWYYGVRPGVLRPVGRASRSTRQRISWLQRCVVTAPSKPLTGHPGRA